MSRPRRTKDHSGTALGAGIGAIVGSAFGITIPGAGLGGLIGSAANPDEPLSLEEAMQQALQQHSLVYVALRRPSRLAAHVVFRAGATDSYFVLKAFVSPKRPLTAEQVDDELFDQLVARLEQWVRDWNVNR
jgi:hypothetical protein